MNSFKINVQFRLNKSTLQRIPSSQIIKRCVMYTRLVSSPKFSCLNLFLPNGSTSSKMYFMYSPQYMLYYRSSFFDLGVPRSTKLTSSERSKMPSDEIALYRLGRVGKVILIMQQYTCRLLFSKKKFFSPKQHQTIFEQNGLRVTEYRLI